MYLAEIFLLQIWQQTALVWFQGYSLPNKQKKGPAFARPKLVLLVELRGIEPLAS